MEASEVTDSAEEGILARESHSDTRYPRVIKRDEITPIPKMMFAKGCGTSVFISKEREDARYFIQGLCFHEPDHEEYAWVQDAWDEAYYCIKGIIRVGVDDSEGNSIVMDIHEGEHAYLPAGYTYTLKPSGVESINFWTVGAIPSPGIKVFAEIGVPNAPDVAKQLTELRKEIAR
jgi:mannose-6-phosphate isomerase-like protein (cupin superfamily)